MPRFRLNPEEKKGILFLVVVIALVVLYRTTWNSQSESMEGEPTDSVISSAISGNENSEAGIRDTIFDPNTADSLTLIRCGLTPWQVRNVMKYRAKGGRWRDAADFRRLYGLTDEQYQRMLPNIRIAPIDRAPYKTEWKNGHQDSSYRNYPKQEKYAVGVRIDPNTADTTEWKRIPGIGSYYSQKICRYRERLGGFVDCRQMREIEGLPGDIEQWVKVEAGFQPQRLRINRATFKQLVRHPYLNYEQTKSIVNYRDKYGALRDFGPLRLDSNFKESDFDRLRPYIDWRE